MQWFVFASRNTQVRFLLDRFKMQSSATGRFHSKTQFARPPCHIYLCSRTCSRAAHQIAPRTVAEITVGRPMPPLPYAREERRNVRTKRSRVHGVRVRKLARVFWWRARPALTTIPVSIRFAWGPTCLVVVSNVGWALPQRTDRIYDLTNTIFFSDVMFYEWTASQRRQRQSMGWEVVSESIAPKKTGSHGVFGFGKLDRSFTVARAIDDACGSDGSCFFIGSDSRGSSDVQEDGFDFQPASVTYLVAGSHYGLGRRREREVITGVSLVHGLGRLPHSYVLDLRRGTLVRLQQRLA